MGCRGLLRILQLIHDRLRSRGLILTAMEALEDAAQEAEQLLKVQCSQCLVSARQSGSTCVSSEL